MPVLAVSKVRKPEQRETRLKSHTFLLLLELEVYFKALRVNSVSESSAIQSSPQAELFTCGACNVQGDSDTLG